MAPFSIVRLGVQLPHLVDGIDFEQGSRRAGGRTDLRQRGKLPSLRMMVFVNPGRPTVIATRRGGGGGGTVVDDGVVVVDDTVAVVVDDTAVVVVR